MTGKNEVIRLCEELGFDADAFFMNTEIPQIAKLHQLQQDETITSEEKFEKQTNLYSELILFLAPEVEKKKQTEDC